MTAPVVICPCCGGPVAPTRLLVDISANRASRNGVTVTLSPRNTEILHLLDKAFPEPAPHGRLMLSLFGRSGGPESTDTLKVHISKLRRVIVPLGLAVISVWGAGYLLVIDNPEVSAKSIHRKNPRWTDRELKALRRYVIDDKLSVVEAAKRLRRSPGGTAHKIAHLALTSLTGGAHG
jgi:DNA-binding winged helix-turn-helix (wHTH) protein